MLLFAVLPLGKMVNVRRVYSDEDKRIILAVLLRKTKPTVLSNGVTKEVAAQFMVPLRVVQRVWFDHLQGIENVCNKKPLNCWCKRVEVDPQAIMQIPPSKRTTLKDLANELGISKSTLHRRFKEKEFRRHSNAIKPRITDDNKKARVRYALSMLDPDSEDPKFQGMYNIVHMDEKWFYKTKGSQNYYLANEEEEPYRSCQSKHYIDKVMFLCVVGRPRYDDDGNCTFDGKIGMFPFVTEKTAERRSGNRPRGTMETKPLNVKRQVSREFLIEKVLPAIKEKWPLEDRWSPIFIQQDNAKTHVLPNDPEFLEAAARGGWDIRLVCQPPNSPDTNILDLGLFAALQSLFQKKSPTSILDILLKVHILYGCFSCLIFC
jgi:DNA-binding Lrp family transcriptional regulator